MASHVDTSWITKIDPSLLNLDEKPQWGHVGPFPLVEIENELKSLFGRDDVKIKIQEEGWVAKDEILKGVGDKPLTLEIFFSSLSHPIFLVTTDRDLKVLSQELLGGEEGSNYFMEEAYIESLTKFFAINLLAKINSLGFGDELSGRVGAYNVQVELEPSFVFNLFLSIGGKSLWARLLVGAPFRRQWKEYFLNKPTHVSKERARKISLELGLVGGETELTKKEWESAKIGDVVLLDTTSLDVEKGKGKVSLTLKSKPLFRGKLLEDGIKILEYPLYEEVGGKMADDETFEQEDNNLYGDLDGEEEVEEEIPPLPFETQEESTGPKKEIELDKIPIQLTVEVGRVGMTLEELMELAPGNVIDIKVEPERGVDLVVNGKKVGKGELVKIGDVLGVRILEL